jgi:hypothetical protein
MKPFKCGIDKCKKGFRTERGAQLHRKIVHVKAEPLSIEGVCPNYA